MRSLGLVAKYILDMVMRRISTIVKFLLGMLMVAFPLVGCSSDDDSSVDIVAVNGSSSSEDPDEDAEDDSKEDKDDSADASDTDDEDIFDSTLGSLFFTEVDPVNITYEDHEGDDAGWVELYNNSADTVNLKGMALAKSRDEKNPWTFGNVKIAPKSFLLVFLSGKNLQDFEAPHDSVSMIGPGCWSWVDAQNDPPGESYSEPLDGKTKICFKEDQIRMFGARMRLGENQELGWSSISTFIGTKSSGQEDVLDISATNELLMHAYITKDRKVSFRLGQTGTDDWKGYEFIFTGTGDSSTVYKTALPQGKTFPDLSIIYGTRMSPESQEKKEVSVKVFSYIARNRGHEPHASFKVKNEGGALYLLSAEKNVVDSIEYPQLPVGKSWSRGKSATSKTWGYAVPSPYAFASSSVVKEQSPSLDTLSSLPPSGFVQSPFYVRFSEDDKVRCEMDGSLPTEHSKLVSSLEVSSTMALRCASFVSGKIPGEVLNRTYVFETLPKMPVVFVNADPGSLFDPDTGIYMEGPYAESKEPHYGANYWQDKEIPVFVEFLEPATNQPAFAKNAGLKIFGNYSRQNAKKSVAITFREKYGDNRLKYPLFPDFPDLKKFKVFLLRNNGSNFGNDYIRDRLSSSISEGLGIDYQRGRGVIVYYNGEYYGIHNIRERSTEYYFETHYGYAPEDIDLLKADNSASAGSAVDYTSLMDWMENHDLSVDENYAYVTDKIDVDNFLNYMHLEMFVNNRDWPANNLKKWRCENPATKWKWFIYDTDFGFGNEYSEYKNNIFEFATAEDGESWPNGPESTFLLRTLLKNNNFKLAFVNRMATLLSMNFESSRTLARISALMSEIESEISRDQKRWNLSSSKMSGQLTKMKSFAKNRPGVILDELQEFFALGESAPVILSVNGRGSIRVHNLPIDQYPVTVNFFAGTPVLLAAEPLSGGTWAGWSDGVMDAERTVLPEDVSSLTAVFK